MTRYAALLRGVNVGGVNLKMAEVAQALEEAGFTNVKTILASGNVLLDSRSGVGAVRKKAERRCATTSATTPGCSPTTWTPSRNLERFPFEREVDGTTRTSRCLRPGRARRARGARRRGRAGEKIEPGNGVIYWQVPRTGTLDSAMGKTMGKKRYKSSTTTRNLRTVEKVLRG